MAFLIISQAYQGDGHHIVRQIQQLLMELVIFQNIPDIAGSDPQGLSHEHRILCRDHGILNGEHQIRFIGSFPEKPGLPLRKLLAALQLVIIKPFFLIGNKQEKDRRLGDKWLVITAFG